MKTTLITSILVLTIFAFACSKKSTPTTFDCTGSTPTYTANVKSLMDLHCATAGCHDAATKADGKNLSNYTDTKSVASNSSFLGSIQHSSGFKSMPQGASKLSDADIKTIACWVQNGMVQ